MPFRFNKRPVLLLEVVIALMLVALCVVPLLAPQAYILYRQQRFLKEVDLDHLVNLLYADIVVRLYRNDIPWNNIIEGTEFQIDPDTLRRINFDQYLPYKGVYRFAIKRQKPQKKESPFTIYLLNLDFYFTPTDVKSPSKVLKYHYEVFLIRYLETGETEILESDTEIPEEEEEPVDSEEAPKT